MLESSDKTIDEIQQILASAEAKFISKRATGVTGDLAMISRRGKPGERKANSEDRCYNFNKFCHFSRDCRAPRKPKSDEPARQPSASASRNRAHIAAANINANVEDDYEPEPFRPGVANMVKN